MRVHRKVTFIIIAPEKLSQPLQVGQAIVPVHPMYDMCIGEYYLSTASKLSRGANWKHIMFIGSEASL